MTTGSGGAFLDTPGGGSVLIPGISNGAAYGINNLGQIVGGFDPGKPSTLWHAFLSNHGQAAVDRNSLLPSSSNWTLTSATGINDKGQIVGYGVDAAGDPHALLLTWTGAGDPTPAAPVPEPSTLACFGLIGAALTIRQAIARASRRRSEAGRQDRVLIRQPSPSRWKNQATGLLH